MPYQAYRDLKNWRHRAKVKLVAGFGNNCCVCGYSKCIGALEFHHLDPKKKSFAVCGSTCNSWERLVEEVKKCILLCANCHREVEQGITKLPKKLPEFQKDLVPNLINRQLKEYDLCFCGREKLKSLKTCSRQCSNISRRKVERPIKDVLVEEIKLYGYEETGRNHQVSGNTIRKWLHSPVVQR